MSNYLEKYNEWCTNSIFDEETKQELQKIKDNQKEIEDRFYKELEFGTGGLRGIIGAGTNRMNKYTVTKATQGLANYIIKNNISNKQVVISYDSRNMSKEFSTETALCLNANGIKTYIFKELRPVPELSYAVRKLGCTAGIMITASHNPPKYNGYKVYWEDGAQVVSPQDKDIINEVKNITDFADVKTISKEEAIKLGLYNEIGESMDDAYIDELQKLAIHPEIIEKEQENIKIVYTPLHGTGKTPVQKILTKLGFKNLYIVPKQAEPDGNFPTVSYPNPEDEKAFTLALELAKEVDADIITATDPDADRLGVYAKDRKTGAYIPFTGNMSAMLIAEYILSQKAEQQNLPENGTLVKSIVSTNMADAIAKYYNIELIEVLTGFKYIGEKMRKFEEDQSYEYVFGFEESYGCLVGTHARDKDGICAVMLLCEAATYYKSKGLTLWDQMKKKKKKYGYYKEGITSITMEGIDGAEKITKIMENLRQNAPQSFGNYKVLKAKDYKTSECINLQTNEKTKIDLPTSNVLYYDLGNDAWCCARPSGTEPKIKFYMGVKGTSMQDAEKQLEDLRKAVLETVKE